ncbi:MAG: hypothetical protein JSW68_00030 [Burkholderiales bacterium]|nr:MAG: hypothetical protein JSW68_00030 [Burkholderiales bacterium]
MASPSITVDPLPADPALQVTTNGTRWLLGPDRTITWALADVPTGDDIVWGEDAARAVEVIGLALDRFEEALDLGFRFTGYYADLRTAEADIVFGATLEPGAFGVPDHVVAWAYFPNEPFTDRRIAQLYGSSSAYPDASGDVLLNASSPFISLSSFEPGSTGFFVLLHEIGHALGLKHPFDDGGTGRPTFEDLGAEGLDNQRFTVMSYDEATSVAAWRASLGLPSSIGYPASLMPLDIFALQSLYGVNEATRAGDDVYRILNDAIPETFWDAGGVDMVTAVDSGFGWAIDNLEEFGGPDVSIAEPIADGEPGFKFFFEVENLVGSSFADALTGSSQANLISGRAGADLIRGRGGDDLLFGGSADDRIDGGSGYDTAGYEGPRAEYAVRYGVDGWQVADRVGPDGIDRLVAIERLEFADKAFELQALPPATAPGFGQSAHFLFDAVFYLLGNPELVPSYTLETAWQHYLTAGARQGLAPASWFDADYYERRWPDLAAAHLDDATLFRHFNLFGVWEGRSPGPRFDAFDGIRYLADNPDVAAYVDAHLPDFLGSRTNGAIAHYVIYGADEGRSAFETGGPQIDLGWVL